MNRHSILPKNQANSSVSPEKVLIDFDISYRSSGSYFRFPAIWRGGTGYNVSLHKLTGHWTDFVGGQKGSLRDLVALLGGDPEKVRLDTSSWSKEIRKEERDKKCKQAMAVMRQKASTVPSPTCPATLYLSENRKIPLSVLEPIFQSGLIRTRKTEDGRFSILSIMENTEGSGEWSGIHEVFVNEAGEKAPGPDGEAKKMLGGSGVTYLPGQGTIDGNRVILVGEGLETVLSGIAGISTPEVSPAAIVCYNNGNMKKLILPEGLKTEGTRILILVDRDLPRGQVKDSNGILRWRPGAGQEAAADLARKLVKVGWNVSLALPPPLPGVEKPDWNDVWITDPESCRDLLLVALRRPLSTEGEIIPIGTIEPGPDDYLPVHRLPLKETPEVIREFIVQEKKGILQITTGAGKSTGLANALPDLEATLTVVRDLEKGQEYETKTNGAAVLYRGRTEEEGPGQCLVIPEVRDLGEKRRSIMAHECATCVHGLLSQASLGSTTAREKLDQMGVQEGQECSWVRQISTLSLSRHVICTEAALQGRPDHLLNFEDYRTGRKVARKIIFDDCFRTFDTFGDGIRIEDISLWIARIDREINLRRESGEDSAWLETLRPSLESLAGMIARSAGSHERIMLDNLPAPERFTDWGEFSAFLRGGKRKEKALDGLSPEKVVRLNGKREIPLRALLDLARAISEGTVFVDRGILNGTFPSLAADILAEPAREVLILDATPTPDVRQAVENAGGTHREIHVHQDNLRTTQFIGRLHGRSSLTNISAEIKHAIRAVEEAIREVGGDPSAVAFLTHMPLADKLKNIREFKGVEVGYFGPDQRAHDRWRGKRLLVVFGVPLRPDLRTIYQHCNQELDWSGVRNFQAVPIPHEISGKQALMTGSSLPEDPEIRQWEREFATAEIIQAIGRLRAVQRLGEDLAAWVITHYPLAPIYGFEINAIRREGGRTSREYIETRWEDTSQRFMIAVSQGGNSFREINRILSKNGLKTISPESYKKLREKADSLDIPEDIDMAALEDAIDEIINNEGEEIYMKNKKMDWEKIGNIVRNARRILTSPESTTEQLMAALILLESVGQPFRSKLNRT